MATNRRDLLKGMFATAFIAPAIIRPESLMKINPSHLWIPRDPNTIYLSLSKNSGTNLGEDVVTVDLDKDCVYRMYNAAGKLIREQIGRLTAVNGAFEADKIVFEVPGVNVFKTIYDGLDQHVSELCDFRAAGKIIIM